MIDCPEWGDLELNSSELLVKDQLQLYSDIAGSKYLRVRLTGSKVVFSATHYIGYVPLNDHVALNVVPRFGISNLTRVLRIAKHAPAVLERFVRAYVADREPLPSIFDDLAGAFIQAVEDVARRGLLLSYVRKTGDGGSPRGRILVTPTVTRHHARGTRFVAASTWHERSTDNPPNRLLKYAMWLVERRFRATVQRKGIARMRTRLNRYYRLFANVELDTSRSFLSDSEVWDATRIPSVRAYYVQAMQLALLLVRDYGLDLNKRAGTVRAPSMLVDLQDAFESYLRNCLGDSLQQLGVTDRVLDGNYAAPVGARKGLFDDPESQYATPDIVVRRPPGVGPGETPLVIEVKYKSHPSRDDINQAIAYGMSYRCPFVVLAHVNREEEGGSLKYEGTIGNLRIYRYSFDLTGDLPTEERRFTEAIQSLLATGAEQGIGPDPSAG